MSVWDDLVGQEKVSAVLDAAARDADALVTAAAADEPLPEASKMTHAWLFTGPPGAGRNQAARAFAAALQCVSPDRALGGTPGCGFCDGCHTALLGTHADVTTVAAVGAEILVKDMRDTVRKSFTAPANGRWQIILVEDAERLNEKSANAVLKAVEEPAPRTVWLLCAPSIEDVLPTIRSRCRHLNLRTPSVEAVADMLVRRDGIEPEVAASAARATQGHVDRARRLATDPAARERRAAVLKLPLRLDEVGACLKAAQGAGRRGCRGRQAARRGDGRQGDRGAEGGARRGPGRPAAAGHGGGDEGPGGHAEAPQNPYAARRAWTSPSATSPPSTATSSPSSSARAWHWPTPTPRTPWNGWPAPAPRSPHSAASRPSPRAARPWTAMSLRCWRWRR